MIEINDYIVGKVKKYVYNMLDQQLPENRVFHTKDHTADVLKNVEIIGNHSGLNEAEMNILRISALFHDTGYTRSYKGHEEESIAIAKEFLTKEQVDESVIHSIISAIVATEVSEIPKDKLSAILCDADLMHLTYENYFENSELLRKEWELAGIAKMKENEFHLNSIKFFEKHHYYSEYGKQILAPKKEKNLQRIKLKLKLPG